MIVHARYPIGEPRIQRQAAAALDGGFEVDVICLRHFGEPPEEVVDGVRVRRLPVSHDRASSVGRMAIEYLRFALLATAEVARLDHWRRYDIIHVSNPPDLLVVSGLIPRFRGADVVFDVHDLTPDLFEWRFGGSRFSPLLRYLLIAQERLALRVADRVTTVHDGCAAVLRKRSARPRQSIAVVMNALDERLLPSIEDKRSKGWHDPVRLVYHGSLTQLYGVHVLLDALAKLETAASVQLTVLGDGDERPRLVRRVAELGLETRVQFSQGFRPIDEALREVAASDIGVVPLVGLPINRFSLPSKLLEYIALKIPVVCARTETIAAHFSDQEVNFSAPGDPRDLARVLAAVVADPAAAHRRAHRAAHRYESYRWAVNRERFLDVIR